MGQNAARAVRSGCRHKATFEAVLNNGNRNLRENDQISYAKELSVGLFMSIVSTSNPLVVPLTPRSC